MNDGVTRVPHNRSALANRPFEGGASAALVGVDKRLNHETSDIVGVAGRTVMPWGRRRRCSVWGDKVAFSI